MMSKRYLLTIFFLAFGLSTAWAQLDQYNFNEDRKIKLSLRYASLNSHGVSEDSVKDVSGIVFRFLDLDKIRYGKGGYQASHRWAFLPETLSAAVVDALNGGDFSWGEKNTSSVIEDFILGWHNHAWALIYTGNISFSGGLHWGDYFMGFEPYNQSIHKYESAHEPAGWYGALGPAMMLDVDLFGRMVWHTEASYAFSTKFSDYPDMKADKAYPNPKFLNITSQIRTNGLFFGGMEYVRSLNNGANPFNVSRTDFFIGVWF